MLNETELRRPDFREGCPVVLADGQVWSVPQPVVRWLPGRSKAGFRTVVSINEQTSDYDELLTQWEDSTNSRGRINAIFGMAAKLLRANYDLTDDQIDEILVFGATPDIDPEPARIFEEMSNIALGNGPKPSAAGTG